MEILFVGPEYATPTTEVTIPTLAPVPTNSLTLAGTKGAYPSPPVDPRDTITPPLGSSFWLISVSLLISAPSVIVVIPENSSVVVLPLSIIL